MVAPERLQGRSKHKDEPVQSYCKYPLERNVSVVLEHVNMYNRSVVFRVQKLCLCEVVRRRRIAKHNATSFHALHLAKDGLGLARAQGLASKGFDVWYVGSGEE